MKKTMTIFLAMILVIAALTGCGSKPAEAPASSAAPTQSAQPSASQEAPPPQGPQTVVIESDDYGDITFEVPSGIAAEVAAPGTDLTALSVDYFGNLGISANDRVKFQKAYLKDDGVNLLVGYNDYTDEQFKTYGTEQYATRNAKLEEIRFGGEDGYCSVYGTLMLSFPATTQHGARVIAIYPDEMPEDNTALDLDEWLYLLDIPWVEEVLASLQFSGEPKTEDRWETQPLDKADYSLTLVDGWEIQSLSGDVCTLKKEGLSDWFTSNEGAGEIHIWPWPMSSASAELADLLGKDYMNLEQQENITINGREFFVLKGPESSSITGYILLTSLGESFDPDAEGVMKLEVRYTFELDDVMPQLEAIIFK